MELSNILILIIILIFTQLTHQMTLSSNLTPESDRIVKVKNRDIELKCLLNENHEEFNRKSAVTWWLKKSCKFPLCLQQKMMNKTEEFEEISTCNGGKFCGTSLILNDSTIVNGIYMCKISPYRINSNVLLQVQFTKSFHVTLDDPNQPPPPDIVEEPNQYSIKSRSQVVLQCKVVSSQTPTVKWFKKRDQIHPMKFNPDDLTISQPIKFFENFYEPLTLGGSNLGLRTNSNSTFLSKLILNDVIKSSVYVCVAINYHGISYREFFINIDNDESKSQQQSEDDQFKELLELPERKYELLFVIPLIILISVSAVLSTILYLLIRSKIAVKTAKVPQ